MCCVVVFALLFSLITLFVGGAGTSSAIYVEHLVCGSLFAEPACIQVYQGHLLRYTAVHLSAASPMITIRMGGLWRIMTVVNLLTSHEQEAFFSLAISRHLYGLYNCTCTDLILAYRLLSESGFL